MTFCYNSLQMLLIKKFNWSSGEEEFNIFLSFLCLLGYSFIIEVDIVLISIQCKNLSNTSSDNFLQHLEQWKQYCFHTTANFIRSKIWLSLLRIFKLLAIVWFILEEVKNMHNLNIQTIPESLPKFRTYCTNVYKDNRR